MNWLRELREEAVLPVRELSRQSGMSMSEDTVTKRENGHRKARPGTIRKLAEALNAQPREGFAPKLQATTRRGVLFRTELPSLVLDPYFWCKALLDQEIKAGYRYTALEHSPKGNLRGTAHRQPFGYDSWQRVSTSTANGDRICTSYPALGSR